MNETKQEKRQTKVEVLNHIIPMLRKTFEKRKELESLKTEIRECQNEIQVRKAEIKALKSLSFRGDRLKAILSKEIEMLKAEILEKQHQQETMEKEIFIEESCYKAQSKLVRGVCLKPEEVEDTVLMLYFMWISKMAQNDLFANYFESTRNFSRTNGSLQLNLISRELNDFPYERRFGNIFNYQVA